MCSCPMKRIPRPRLVKFWEYLGNYSGSEKTRWKGENGENMEISNFSSTHSCYSVFVMMHFSHRTNISCVSRYKKSGILMYLRTDLYNLERKSELYHCCEQSRYLYIQIFAYLWICGFHSGSYSKVVQATSLFASRLVYFVDHPQLPFHSQAGLIFVNCVFYFGFFGKEVSIVSLLKSVSGHLCIFISV